MDNDLYLPVSIRADFVDCSTWVEAVVRRDQRDKEQEVLALADLQKINADICYS